MSLKTRILALATSAALLMTPAASMAEEVGYYAGELTPVVIEDSYYAGQQINVNVGFGMGAGDVQNEKLAALSRLLEKCKLSMSFYDDFGTARVRGNLTLDGMQLLTLDALIAEDGSVQAMTNLTGKYVLTLPEGSIVDGQLKMEALNRNDKDYYDMTPEEFKALPAADRLKITLDDMGALLLQHVLGWVSYTQMNTGRLYSFDDTYLDATETRDAVSQRMIGQVHTAEFIELLWNIACTINDEQGDFQQALADVLAGAGVTRAQMRNAIDAIFTEETIDPSADYVETTYSVMQNNPDDPCQYADVSYFFKKLVKCIDHVWDYSTDDWLSLIVSYDDFGKTVGLDAKLPVFSTVLPYEGDFVYSLKTDDNWQETHTAHGELQVLGDNRIVGDMKMVKGQDVDGVNASSLNGTLDLVNTVNGEAMGFAVDSVLTSTLNAAGTGETIVSLADITLRGVEMDAPVISAELNAETLTDGNGFTLTGAAIVSLLQQLHIELDVDVQSAEYDEQAFAGGPAIDVVNFDEASAEAIGTEVAEAVAKLMPGFLLKFEVMSDITTLMGE